MQNISVQSSGLSSTPSEQAVDPAELEKALIGLQDGQRAPHDYPHYHPLAADTPAPRSPPGGAATLAAPGTTLTSDPLPIGMEVVSMPTDSILDPDGLLETSSFGSSGPHEASHGDSAGGADSSNAVSSTPDIHPALLLIEQIKGTVSREVLPGASELTQEQLKAYLNTIASPDRGQFHHPRRINAEKRARLPHLRAEIERLSAEREELMKRGSELPPIPEGDDEHDPVLAAEQNRIWALEEEVTTKVTKINEQLNKLKYHVENIERSTSAFTSSTGSRGPPPSLMVTKNKSVSRVRGDDDLWTEYTGMAPSVRRYNAYSMAFDLERHNLSPVMSECSEVPTLSPRSSISNFSTSSRASSVSARSGKSSARSLHSQRSILQILEKPELDERPRDQPPIIIDEMSGSRRGASRSATASPVRRQLSPPPKTARTSTLHPQHRRSRSASSLHAPDAEPATDSPQGDPALESKRSRPSSDSSTGSTFASSTLSMAFVERDSHGRGGSSRPGLDSQATTRHIQNHPKPPAALKTRRERLAHHHSMTERQGPLTVSQELRRAADASTSPPPTPRSKEAKSVASDLSPPYVHIEEIPSPMRSPSPSACLSVDEEEGAEASGVESGTTASSATARPARTGLPPAAPSDLPASTTPLTSPPPYEEIPAFVQQSSALQVPSADRQRRRKHTRSSSAVEVKPERIAKEQARIAAWEARALAIGHRKAFQAEKDAIVTRLLATRDEAAKARCHWDMCELYVSYLPVLGIQTIITAAKNMHDCLNRYNELAKDAQRWLRYGQTHLLIRKKTLAETAPAAALLLQQQGVHPEQHLQLAVQAFDRGASLAGEETEIAGRCWTFAARAFMDRPKFPAYYQQAQQYFEKAIRCPLGNLDDCYADSAEACDILTIETLSGRIPGDATMWRQRSIEAMEKAISITNRKEWEQRLRYYQEVALDEAERSENPKDEGEDSDDKGSQATEINLIPPAAPARASSAPGPDADAVKIRDVLAASMRSAPASRAISPIDLSAVVPDGADKNMSASELSRASVTIEDGSDEEAVSDEGEESGEGDDESVDSTQAEDDHGSRVVVTPVEEDEDLAESLSSQRRSSVASVARSHTVPEGSLHEAREANNARSLSSGVPAASRPGERQAELSNVSQFDHHLAERGYGSQAPGSPPFQVSPSVHLQEPAFAFETRPSPDSSANKGNLPSESRSSLQTTPTSSPSGRSAKPTRSSSSSAVLSKTRSKPGSHRSASPPHVTREHQEAADLSIAMDPGFLLETLKSHHQAILAANDAYTNVQRSVHERFAEQQARHQSLSEDVSEQREELRRHISEQRDHNEEAANMAKEMRRSLEITQEQLRVLTERLDMYELRQHSDSRTRAESVRQGEAVLTSPPGSPRARLHQAQSRLNLQRQASPQDCESAGRNRHSGEWQSRNTTIGRREAETGRQSAPPAASMPPSYGGRPSLTARSDDVPPSFQARGRQAATSNALGLQGLLNYQESRRGSVLDFDKEAMLEKGAYLFGMYALQRLSMGSSGGSVRPR